MKKLLFATALVATAAAFADGPISAISFEGYTAGATFVNGAAELDETGTAKTPDGPYFYYDGDQDGSSVKAFGGENPAAPNISPRSTYFSGNNLNYLDLSTEGGILWRGINNITQGGTQEAPEYSLGTAATVAADGIYLDTLVQFTPTEDGGTPELDGDDKLAIWLNVDSTTTPPTTNLMVRAGYVDDNGTATSTLATNYVLSTASPVVPGTWYRLTVKTIADVTQCKAKNGEYNPNGITGFEIYLDRVQLAADRTTIGNGYIDRATDSGEYGWLDQGTDADFVTYLQSGKVFPSLKGETSTDTLTAVGFKGSGALDDIVWTEEDPLAGGSSSDYVVEIGGSDVVIQPQAGDLEALQAAIVAGGGTLDVTDVDAVNAALDANIGTTGVKAWQALFLGLAPTEAGLAAFKIDSISFNGDGDVEVTLPAGVTLMTGRGVDITLKVMAAAEPNAAAADWDEATSATGSKTLPPITPAANATKEFYKVVVEFAASAAQN